MIKFCYKELDKCLSDSYESYTPEDRNLILPLRLKYKEYGFVASSVKELSAEFPLYSYRSDGSVLKIAQDYFVLIMPQSAKQKK